jgi:hypothetical protein
MTDGNTLLGDVELEKLVVLRMNREFMEYMRNKFSHLSQQQFNMSVVSEAENIENIESEY